MLVKENREKRKEGEIRVSETAVDRELSFLCCESLLVV
jgi:hypothetical protein